jgi:chromosomal replication initiator protein
VLTANRKPHEISNIADRLRTRFAWGLLADLEPPDLGVRIALLRKKGHGRGGRPARRRRHVKGACRA